MIDLKFIEFYIRYLYNKSVEEYYHVKRPTVSNWRKRGIPKKYIEIFIDTEKSSDIFELFKRIYTI
jgi:hypothetical protein